MDNQQDLNLLITGATGFVGRNLLNLLAKKRPNWNVYGIGRDTERLNQCARIFSGFKAITCDLSKELPRIDKAIDVVLHLASWVAPPREEAEGWEKLLYTNAFGTMRLWRQIQQMSPRPSRFINVSSITVYGDPFQMPVAENDPRNPSNFYGLSKLGGELCTEYFSAKLTVPAINVRLGYVYGPDDDSGKVVYKWADAARSGSPIVIGTSPHVFRDYVYVGDVNNILLRLIEEPSFPRGLRGAINLSPSRGVTLLQLAQTLQRLGGNRAPIQIRSVPGDWFGGCVIQSGDYFWEVFSDFRFTELEEGLRGLVS